MITVVWLHYQAMVLYTTIHRVRQNLSIESFILSLQLKTDQQNYASTVRDMPHPEMPCTPAIHIDVNGVVQL